MALVEECRGVGNEAQDSIARIVEGEGDPWYRNGLQTEGEHPKHQVVALDLDSNPSTLLFYLEVVSRFDRTVTLTRRGGEKLGSLTK